jgi:hypothetical protein
MKTVLFWGVIAITAISISSCESGKSKVAKMEQISINGVNYGLELLPDSAFYLHPEGSNGKEGHLFDHIGGSIYVSYSCRVARAMLPPESFEDGKEKRVAFNLDLKKIIFATEWEGPAIWVFPTEELLVPGGKAYGVVITSCRAQLSRSFCHHKVYTLDGVLRYDNQREYEDIVIEGGYIYDARLNGYRPPTKVNKIFPDGSKEQVPDELRKPDPQKSISIEYLPNRYRY